MQDNLLSKYIKRKNPKGMDMLIDNYGGIITSVVRKHLGTLINYEEECINDVLLSIWEELLIKYDIEGYALDEIAKENKTNVTHLHSRLSRGRKKIKKTLNYKEV